MAEAEKDPLSQELSASFEQTPTGFKAGVKSRLAASIDRLGGAAIDAITAPLEGFAARRRAATEGDVAMIQTAAADYIAHMGEDPAKAQRILATHFKRLAVQQENVDGVISHAEEQLRLPPPAARDNSAASQPDMSDEFLDRFSFYAQTASTEQLRSRWGRVLASEVLQTGTFTAKALRIVDELDGYTAQLFEQLCTFKVAADEIPIALSGLLRFEDRLKLVGAGLIVEPGITGHVSQSHKENDPDEVPVHLFEYGELSLGFKSSPAWQSSGSQTLTTGTDETATYPQEFPAIPVYVLTDVGAAIATILPADQTENLHALARKVAGVVKNVPWVRVYRRLEGSQVQLAEYQVSNAPMNG